MADFVKNRYLLITVALVLALTLLVGNFLAPLSLPAGEKIASAIEATPTPNPLPLDLGGTEEEKLLTAIYRQVIASVVNITVVKRVEVAPGLPGFPPIPGLPSIPRSPEEFYQEGQGSGFVWDEQGHIVTNNHVVEEADTVEVIFWDDTVVRAEVVGTDPDSDLAVIKVDPAEVELHSVTLGDSDALAVGQMAIAIGNPFGQAGTMTHGIISALGRTFRPGGSPFAIPEMIQTDAAINPGNSGGPILNSKGEVIGINTLILSRSGSSAGVGFAVPINIAKRVVPVLIEKGEYHHSWLGISGTDVAPAIAELMNLPAGTRGALIIELSQGGPADRAGLRGSDKTAEINGRQVKIGGDVIIAIDDSPVRRMDDLIAYLVEETQPGQQVELTILREGEEQKVTLELGERPRRE
ncbi:MAG: S1C family serine protease [Candidatus Neomarinimicrobiota bacterium]